MEQLIYVEHEAASYPLTERILECFSKSQVVYIDNANDLFNRTNQNYALQKKYQSVILAVNHGKFVYEASNNCQSFGADNFYYVSACKNCIYNCDYCYLQGMFRSGNILVYVNTDDCFREVDRLLEKTEGELLLPISYDSDVYALEEPLGFIEAWSNYLETKDERLTVELRTKCGTMQFLDKIKAKKNFVVTWSLNPDEIIKRYEKRTSPLEDRLKAIEYALSHGIRTRVAIDPVIAVCDALEAYKNLAKRLAPFAEKLDGVSVGMFRIPTDFLKIMRKNAKMSPLSWDDYEVFGRTKTYSKEISENYLSAIVDELVSAGVPAGKIFVQNVKS